MQKFGEIQFSDPGIYDIGMCTAGIYHFTGVNLAMFTREQLC